MLEKNKIISILDEVMKQTSKLRKGGDQLLYKCVKCHHHKRKLEISLENDEFGIFHCWICGFSGNLYNLLEFCNAPKSYYGQIKSLTGHVVKKNYNSFSKSPMEISLPKEFLPLSISNFGCPEYRNAMQYIKNRGILLEDILRYNIGYCCDGEYKYHIIIPSYDAEGKLNFFIGRRYYKTEGSIPYKKPNFPMNIVGFEMLINWQEPLILVESVFNAVTIRRNVIPLFGKFPSKKLYEKMIINEVKSVYVFLDSDAIDDAIHICKKLLALGITPFFVNIKEGKDANEIGFEKSWDCIKNSKEFDFDYLLSYELKI